MAWIAGRVSLRTEERWEFRDPCLTMTEARDLATWLAEAAAGTVEVVQNPSEERILAFTEPVLAFSVAGRDDCEVVVRVHLSLEALPGLDTPSEAVVALPIRGLVALERR
ncbi:WapI family immunity protein [Actinopolymorpha singaporensis]|uniref:Uncharacterized protein n=1 Tax=Actinopolymorpha singaporensis TaxID=117157 RepID=A0A1H1LPL4_9ACTN|nr:hypothetical protein [Actinopolymorpha singaporensis]SDR76252.1 hypothetical protein SAMN04489717_0447 [Actinopolymorpha singaporensis]